MKSILTFSLMMLASAGLYADDVIRIYGDGQQTVMEYKRGANIQKVVVDPVGGPKYILTNQEDLGGPTSAQPAMMMELRTPSWIVKEW